MIKARGARVAVLMGSDSDLPAMAKCLQVLEQYRVPYSAQVLSAHRTPVHTVRFVRAAERRGVRIFIAGAGGAAHLAGTVAAHTTLPVIGVPLDSSPLKGLDALLATVQMPPGVPVATVGVGSMGAANAAHLAVAILALKDGALRLRLRSARQRMAREVLAKSRSLERRLRELLPSRPARR